MNTRFSLNSTDRKKIVKDLAYFFIVPLIFYITAILGTIQQTNHIISIVDFVPSNSTLIVIVAWLLNQILSILRKYIS
jgi:hypothetical protein